MNYSTEHREDYSPPTQPRPSGFLTPTLVKVLIVSGLLLLASVSSFSAILAADARGRAGGLKSSRNGSGITFGKSGASLVQASAQAPSLTSQHTEPVSLLQRAVLKVSERPFVSVVVVLLVLAMVAACVILPNLLNQHSSIIQSSSSNNREDDTIHHSSDSKGLPVGGIVGIVMAAAAVLSGAGIFVWAKFFRATCMQTDKTEGLPKDMSVLPDYWRELYTRNAGRKWESLEGRPGISDGEAKELILGNLRLIVEKIEDLSTITLKFTSGYEFVDRPTYRNNQGPWVSLHGTTGARHFQAENIFDIYQYMSKQGSYFKDVECMYESLITGTSSTVGGDLTMLNESLVVPDGAERVEVHLTNLKDNWSRFNNGSNIQIYSDVENLGKHVYNAWLRYVGKLEAQYRASLSQSPNSVPTALSVGTADNEVHLLTLS